MKKRFFFPLLLAFGAVEAQTTCGCHATITKDGNYRASQLKLQPGQTLCIQAGQYSYLRFNDLLGAPGAPIRIVNCGGLVNVLSSSHAPGIQLMSCRHVVLTGSGDASLPYGFKLNNTGTTAGSVLNVTGRSSDVEIERCEVSNNNFAGIMVKQDPGCDSSFYRENFTMYNVNIHHNYVHDTGGEGLYIGNSFWNGGRTVTCGGVSRTAFPHELHGLQIHHNVIERTGCEGIQYGCSPGASVHHNTVRGAGLSPFASFQNNGIQIGEGSSGECHNNLVDDAPGGGIIAVGHSGDLKVYNNVVANIGNIGIFCDNRSNSLSGTVFALLNNTVVNCANEGIKLYNENTVNTVGNNVIAGVPANKFILFAQGATATQFNNLRSTRTDTLGFANPAAGDFRPTAASALVNAGADVSGWGITTDYDDAPRPAAGSAPDVGAFEFQPGGVLRQAAESPARAPLTVEAYPSPTRDRVTFRLSEPCRVQQVVVYRPDGQVMARLTPNRTTQQVHFDARTLKPGVYPYRAFTDRGSVAGRFVRQ